MKKLIAAYQNILDHPEKIYIIPSIDKAKQTNSYMELFYKDVWDDLPFESLTPMQYPKLFGRRILGEKSILHMHWYNFSTFKSFVLWSWRTFWILLYKLAGGKIVWTIHNKQPHEKKYTFINLSTRKMMAHLADRLHVHCNEAVEIMQRYFGVDKEKFFIVEHPAYPSEKIPKEEALDTYQAFYGQIFPISAEDTVYLMFGQVAEYKGIMEVITNFPDTPGKKLLIVGSAKSASRDYAAEIICAAEQKENIGFINTHIPEQHIAVFFSLAECVVFNYKEILTSGGIHLAVSYGANIISNREGCIKDLDYDKITFFSSDQALKNLLSETQDKRV